MKNITTVILAAGKSSRFKHKKSKIFHKLAGLRIIEHVFSIAKKISNQDIIFVCNNNNIDELKKIFPYSNFVVQKKQLGTADAIFQAKKFLKNTNVLILFGDVPLISILSVKKLIKDFYKNKSYGSMIAFKTNNPFGYGRIKNDGKLVHSIVEEINTNSEEKKNKLCNSGVMICSSKLLFNHIDKISSNNIKKEKYLPDIFSIFYKKNIGFSYIIGSENEMLGINTITNLVDLEKMYQNQLKLNLIKNGTIMQNPESIFLSYDTKIKKGCTIESHVIFKTGVSIKENVFVKSHSLLEECIIGNNSSIGPFARIRPNSIIGNNVKIGNYVEVKNSIIGNNTAISHLSYIGDSRVGKNVNIGAGTITCNYNGKKKNKTIIEDRVFIGSNSSLIAPLKIGKNSTIGAGSVITEDIPQNHLAVERSELVIFKKNRK